MRRPTEVTEYTTTVSGRTRKETFYSYVATLARKIGYEVLAVRYDHQQNKVEVYKHIQEDYPDWNLKGVLKLYDEDFR